MPEIVPMLREDVQQAVNENGGEFTSLALQNMKKLDSFLREVLRYYPGNTCKHISWSISHMNT